MNILKLRTFIQLSLSSMLICSVLFSCVSKKELATLQTLREENRELRGKLDSVLFVSESKSEAKMSRGELDTVSAAKLRRFFDSLDNSVAAVRAADSLSALQKVKTGNIDEKVETARFQHIQLQTNLENANIVNDLLGMSTFVRFSTGALFGPGKYEIFRENRAAAFDAFQPVLDSLYNFISRYPGKKFDAVVVVLGYADGQGISEGESDLYNFLASLTGKESPERADLNFQLSRLRAESVAKIIHQLMYQRMKADSKYRNISLERVISQGRGEEYPNPSINDYQASDERRRVVLVYWNALPG